VEIHKLNVVLEKARALTCTVESIKAQTLAVSEKLDMEENELLDLLINIQASNMNNLCCKAI
jgi:hypothetical protein